jgi:hypothetical protein
MGSLSMVDHLIKVACFVKIVNNVFIVESSNLNYLGQGGQLYNCTAFSSSKCSLANP